jgi:Domain of unknown function (DUF4357)
MNNPCVLSLFLVDGSADGLKIIEKSNWNGCGLACPKKVLFDKHLKEAQFNKPGVYVLVGESDESILRKHLYIGEGDPVIRRLEDHFRKKEWWTEVIVFTSTDQTLNKAFVQYFEAQLIQLARNTGRYSIENGNIPIAPSLSKRELAICEGFLREILLCLPLLGINLEPNTQPMNESNALLFIRAKGLEARGIEISDGFLVLAYSEIASEETKTIPKSIQLLRSSLIEKGIVRDDGDKLRFTVDHRFGSPSTASSVILGCSSNGRDVWKNQSGESLKSIQFSRLGC